MIRATKVDFAYSTGPFVLRGIDAEFESGKLTALIGPNGSGKSTLARLIAGLIAPTGGTIEINGSIAPKIARDDTWAGEFSLAKSR